MPVCSWHEYLKRVCSQYVYYITYLSLAHKPHILIQRISPNFITPPLCSYPNSPLEETLVLATMLIWAAGSNTSLESVSHSIHTYYDRVSLHKCRTSGLSLPPGNIAAFTVNPNFARWGKGSPPHQVLRNSDINIKNIVTVSYLEIIPGSNSCSCSPMTTVSTLLIVFPKEDCIIITWML